MKIRKFFGNYRLVTSQEGTPVELAREANVVTYKGVHVATGDPVTLMWIPRDAVEPGVRERFEAEVSAAQLLDHPNIAAIRQFQAEDDFFVCASEYFDGQTLEAWVDQHGPMPADTAVRIGSQVVNALAAAAFHSVPHGALKPSNLMIVPGTTPAGEWPLVKVLNFGLSRVRPYRPGATGSAGPQRSPEYSSPEHLVQGEVDFRSDIYSLGATLWFLVSGAAPVSAAAVETSTGVHKAFRALVAQMLSISPTERPQDPVVLEQQLRDCLERVEQRPAAAGKFGLPVAAAPAAVVPALVERAPRRPLPVKPLAIAALLLAVALLGALILPRATGSFSSSEPKPLGVPIGVPVPEESGTRVAGQTQPPIPAAPDISETPAVAPPAATPRGVAAAEAAAALPTASASPARPVVAAAELQQLPPPPAPSPARETAAPAYAQNTAPAAPDYDEPAAPAEGQDEAVAAPPTAVADSSTTSSRDVTAAPEITDAPAVASRSTPAPAATPGAAQRQIAATEATPAPGRSARRADSTRSTTRTASRDRIPVRRALPPDPEEARLPRLPAGAQRARYLGTDENGAMVFGLPSSERVYAAPPTASSRRLSPRQRIHRSLFGRNEEVRPAEPVDDIYEDED